MDAVRKYMTLVKAVKISKILGDFLACAISPSVNNVALTQVTTGAEYWRANFHNVYRNLRSHKNNI